MSIDDFNEQVKEELTKLNSAEAEVTKELPTVEAVDSPATEMDEDPIEREARDMGWNPDHKGDKFVSAKEFVERGSFFKKIDSQNKKIDDLVYTVKELAEHNKKVESAAYNKGIQDALVRQREAVINGDLEEFDRASRDINTINTAAPPPKSTEAPLSSDAKEFIDKNKSWFNQETPENAEMFKFAVVYGDALQKANPNLSDAQVIKELESVVKMKFPTRFENPNINRPASVGVSTKSKGELVGLAAKLTSRQKEFFKNAKSYGLDLTMEDYAKQLKLTGALKDD